MKIRLLTLFVFFTFISFAKDIKVDISYNTYLTSAGKTYIELYYLVDPTSVSLIQKDSTFKGAIDITLLFTRGENVINYDKLRIPVSLNDTLNTSPVLQISRLMLDTGVYQLEVNISDPNSETLPIELNQPFRLVFDYEQCSFSRTQFLDSYKKAEIKSEFTKNGYDLFPLVGMDLPYIHTGFNKLSFYSELYLTNTFVEDESLIINYYIRDEIKETKLNKYGGYVKRNKAEIIPILSSLNIENLRTGNYSLVIKALDKNKNVLASDSSFFYRQNLNLLEDPILTFDSLEFASVFTSKITDFDSIYKYIEVIYPISSLQEREYAHYQIEGKNIYSAQRYFYSFWHKRNPNDPEAEWLRYYKTVKEVDNKYKTPIMPGYRTARGRVFLQYGPPYLIETELSDPRSYPYEIWQYDQLQSASTPTQVSKIFIFAKKILASNDFQLIHSDATGETYNPRWKLEIHTRDYQPGSIEETGGDWYRGHSGSSYDNNIIMGTSNQRRNY